MIAPTQTEALPPRYRPLMELGRGGMARVYLAESLTSGLQKLVVLKVLNQDLASDADMREAFAREAEISAKLNHPNIVNVYEVFQQSHTPVMVMQYLDGMALSEISSRLKGQFPLRLHLNVLCQMLDALHYFHELKTVDGVSLQCVHRDVSPHNVMVLHEGGIKVVDFGVAKVRMESENHTRTGIIKGKVAYMPPEQLLSCANVDRRADIYSVGVMLWEAVAGRRMWHGMDTSSRMRAIVSGQVPSIREAAPGVSDALAKVIERALEHAPDGRYATAEQMQIELEQAIQTEGGLSLPRELAEFMRNHFGEHRRTRRQAIEEAMGDPEFSVSDASWSASTPSAIELDASVVQAANTHQAGPAQSWYRSPRVAARTAWLGGLLGVVGAALFVSLSPSYAGRSSEPKPAGTSVETIVTERSESPVRLQERPDPSSALPRAEQTDAQTGEAPALNDILQGSEEPAVEETEQRRPSRAKRRRAAKRRAARSASAEIAAPAAPAIEEVAPVEPKAAANEAAADECNPPYRLDLGGVKVFKPQCFQ